ncbi:MAG TPA: STAS/SEC14 domain-containing protein, partial [Gammaproteobacteria bacterium]
MLQTIPFTTGDTVGFRIEGKVSDEEFDRAVAEIDEKLAIHGKLMLYTEVESFGGMPVKTFFKDLRYGLKHRGDFQKAAVVTDSTLLGKLAEAGDSLL